MKYSGFGLDVDFADSSWSWTLSGENSIMFHGTICLLYLNSVVALQRFMNGKAVEGETKSMFDQIKYVHNLALSALSFYMGAIQLYQIIMDGRFNSFHSMACQNTTNSGWYGHANFLYLVSKIWEWGDTYLLILYAKPVIPLHSFHHMTTFTMAALTHNFPVGGFAFINCAVHTVMYLHYAQPQRWARPFITTFQLLQFVCVVTIHTYGYLTPSNECFDFSAVGMEWWYCQIVVVLYFLMFCKFFADNYVTKDDRANKEKKEKKRKE